MMKQRQYSELVDNKLFTIIIVSGLSLSAFTIFMVSLDNNNINSISTVSDGGLCAYGLCHISNTDTIPIGTYVQQSEKNIFEESIVNNNEIFSNISLIKNTVMVPEKSGNVVQIFSSKDSFIREGIQYSNEGSNKVIRVMGAGPTNNRALIAFDQSQIESFTDAKSIESAKLRLYVVSNDQRWDSKNTIDAHRLTSDWLEGSGSNAPFSPIKSQKGVTWDCSNDLSNCELNWNGGFFLEVPSDSVTITNELQSSWIEFDVTKDVRSFIDGSPNFGWIIIKSDEDSSGRINFASKESSNNVPQLVITLKE